MGIQSEDSDIYSMCNCITLGLPRTYTAHAMTMDMFLAYAEPGTRYPRPHIDLWPKTFIKVFKFPPVVKVFVFSIFNEVYLPSYVWRDRPRGERFTMGFNDQYSRLRKLSYAVRHFNLEEFCERLIRVGKQVDQIWCAKKMLLRYDLTRATAEVRDSFLAYGCAVEAAVDWPIVEVVDPKGPPSTSQRPHLWCHYSEESRRVLHNDILRLEMNYRRRGSDG